MALLYALQLLSLIKWLFVIGRRERSMKSKNADKRKAFESVMRMVTKYVKSGPFFLNPDKATVKDIISGLVKNRIEYGYAYCPCRTVKGIPEEDKENICPCRRHKEDIARQGTCECGLFVSEAYLAEKQQKQDEAKFVKFGD